MQNKKIVLASQSHSIHVLVAEDDPYQRLALIDILTLCQYTCQAVENGRAARDELLKENNYFDIVLLDVMMPEMDGLELLKLMKSNDKLQNIPVIMMSSDGDQQLTSTCLQIGAKDYFVKPVRIGNVKQLADYAAQNSQPKAPKPGDQKFFKKIKNIGSGAAGSVELV